MSYKRKTRDVWRLYLNYGYGHGWEETCEEDTRTEIKIRVKEYRENQPEFPRKVRKARVRLENR